MFLPPNSSLLSVTFISSQEVDSDRAARTVRQLLAKHQDTTSGNNSRLGTPTTPTRIKNHIQSTSSPSHHHKINSSTPQKKVKMHKGEDNASSSEDGKEQMNFNLLLAQINLMISSDLGLGGLQKIYVLMLIHFNGVVLSGRTNNFSELKYVLSSNKRKHHWPKNPRMFQFSCGTR